jgi:hypothetical protein
MLARQQAADPHARQPSYLRKAMLRQARELLLWYWALSVPRGDRLVRAIYMQIVAGMLLTLIGLPLGLLGYVPLLAGVIVSLSGLVFIGLSYLISLVYHSEYPGRFNPRLEEYVARRVSRLHKDHFIPQFRVHGYSHTATISDLNRQVRQALRIELRRLELSDEAMAMPVCGVLVLGPKHSNKTGALWDAMAQELKGWTFVQWPHHMDHPANLARSVGHRVVLWVDDLQDYAHPGEAASLVQFVQQVRAQGRSLMLLTSCRDGQGRQEAERYFRPLMQQLRVVFATTTLPLVPQLQALEEAYRRLSGSQKSILDAMSWLKSVGVLTFPEDVLRVLSPFFPYPEAIPNGESRGEDWKVVVRALSQHDAKFARVDQRADAKERLSGESYNFVVWVLYNLLNRFPRSDTVIVPINVHYLDLERLRSDRARTIATALEQKPEAVIQTLAVHAVAAETLILLGDAYLSRLGEDLDNANELAIKCYKAAFVALQQFPTVTSPARFPGAWAAALVGKGHAELREGRAQDAEDDFRQITDHSPAAPSAHSAAMIPTTLLGRAWRGRGDALHAQAARATGAAATTYLREAAVCYASAAQTLAADDPARDPLWGETKLDYANTLYALVEASPTQSVQRLADATVQLSADTARQLDGGTSRSGADPFDDIAAARSAYQEAQLAYSRAAAPAVWAEIERRLGTLCLMSAQHLLRADVKGAQPALDGLDGSDVIPLANQRRAIELAKQARNHFVAAREVFTPSYLPMSWSSTQLSLAHALLILARFTVPEAGSQAWDSYALCLETTKAVATQVSTLTQAPLDWVDLQLLRAEAEIGRAPLDEGGPAPHFGEAKAILNKTNIVLTDFERMTGNLRSDRMKSQEAKLKSLTRTLEQVAKDA